MASIDKIVQRYSAHAEICEWEQEVEGVEPKMTDCGPVFEPDNPLGRSSESYAIADMRNVEVAEPHYHTNGETEIYIVLTGLGLTVCGGEEIEIEKGSVVVTPPNTTHFTIPRGNLVLMVINAPPFNPANNVSISETDASVGFDKDQYDRLTA